MSQPIIYTLDIQAAAPSMSAAAKQAWLACIERHNAQPSATLLLPALALGPRAVVLAKCGGVGARAIPLGVHCRGYQNVAQSYCTAPVPSLDDIHHYTVQHTRTPLSAAFYLHAAPALATTLLRLANGPQPILDPNTELAVVVDKIDTASGGDIWLAWQTALQTLENNQPYFCISNYTGHPFYCNFLE